MDPVQAQQQQQQQQQELMMDEFRAGLTACLRSWSALRTAVESGWGGNESLKKAEDLRTNILEHLDGSCFPPRIITIDDLEDNLAIYMEEEFSVVLEDNSERQVADAIWRMYEGCHKGDPSLARQLVSVAKQALAASAAYPVQIQSPEHDEEEDDDGVEDTDAADDDDDDEEMQDTTTTETAPQLTVVQPRVGTGTTAKEYASQYLFGEPRSEKKPFVPTGPIRQLGETPIAEEQPAQEVVDEDGFAMVATNKNRRKARKPV